MFIGFDGSRIAKKFHTGTEHYSVEILKALAKIDSRNQYLIYSPKPISHKVGDLPHSFSYKVIPFPKLWTQFRLSWEMFFGKKPDVLFIPSHTIPLIHPKKTVVVVHDLGFKYFPELYGKNELIYQDFGLKMAAKNACHIITVSQNTKNDLIKFCCVSPEKISVIYHGYNDRLYRPLERKAKSEKRQACLADRQAPIANRQSLIANRQPYIFFVGRLEKKKNAAGMIRAFGLLRQNPAIKHKLVLAGKAGYGYEEIKKERDKLPQSIKNDIIELGYVAENDLAEWMKNADVFFFPSFFEGFGLPVIEAMACGVPVVASNTTSIPEIAGNAALLVNPDHIESMTKALSDVIFDRNLRQDFIQKGLVRAKDFSWQKAAEKTLKVLEDMNKNHLG